MAAISEEQVVATLRAAGCVFAEDEARMLIVAAGGSDRLAAMVAERAAGHPLEQVVGWAQFCGLRIVVEPGVFVPRRRSEFLVAQAALRSSTGAVILDLCCGSGALGLALLAELGAGELHASDVDPVEVRCARGNIAGAGEVYEGDLYAALPGTLRGRVDILLANVPYVPTGALGLMPAEARLYEAPVALNGGADGLDVLRRVAAAAPAWLRPGGALFVEASDTQTGTALGILTTAGLAAELAYDDDLEVAVVIGRRPE